MNREKQSNVTEQDIVEVLEEYGMISDLQDKYKKELGILNCTTLRELYYIVAKAITK